MRLPICSKKHNIVIDRNHRCCYLSWSRLKAAKNCKAYPYISTSKPTYTWLLWTFANKIFLSVSTWFDSLLKAFKTWWLLLTDDVIRLLNDRLEVVLELDVVDADVETLGNIFSTLAESSGHPGNLKKKKLFISKSNIQCVIFLWIKALLESIVAQLKTLTVLSAGSTVGVYETLSNDSISVLLVLG